MTEFQIEETFPVNKKEIFEAWLDSEQHSAMTGATAECSHEKDGPFTAWNNYIKGKNITLEPYKRIVQSWRTTEFEAEDLDSEITIELEDTDNGTRLILTHKNIPEGQSDYRNGWMNHYFKPMKAYFSK